LFEHSIAAQASRLMGRPASANPAPFTDAELLALEPADIPGFVAKPTDLALPPPRLVGEGVVGPLNQSAPTGQVIRSEPPDPLVVPKPLETSGIEIGERPASQSEPSANEASKTSDRASSK
jgi:hypothetical protein